MKILFSYCLLKPIPVSLIISNALKFYKNDGSLSKVEIYSQKVSAGQVKKYPTLDPKLSYCEVIIKDNGIGFNKQYDTKK